MCNSTVVIPAILRVLGVGDPFMREDTVGPEFSAAIEAARFTSTRIELGFPTSYDREITDSCKSEGAISSVTSGQPDLVGSDVKDDRRHRLSM